MYVNVWTTLFESHKLSRQDYIYHRGFISGVLKGLPACQIRPFKLCQVAIDYPYKTKKTVGKRVFGPWEFVIQVVSVAGGLPSKKLRTSGWDISWGSVEWANVLKTYASCGRCTVLCTVYGIPMESVTSTFSLIMIIVVIIIVTLMIMIIMLEWDILIKMRLQVKWVTTIKYKVKAEAQGSWP